MRILGVLLVIAGMVGVARADEKKDNQKRADALFAEGRKLIDAKDDVGACAKFTEAIHLDPDAAGTMLNLGLCNEHLKNYKTALYWFRKAQARAHESKLPEYETAAGDHTEQLAKLVATVKIVFTKPPPDTAKVRIDGEDIRPDDYLHAEVDPGHHVLEAGATGHKSVRREFDVKDRGGDELSIELVEGDNSVIIDRGANRRKIAIITAVGGGVLLVASGVVSIYAKHKYDECISNTAPIDPLPMSCVSDTEARKRGNDYQQLARWVGTPLFVGGALAVGIATYVYLTAPQRERIDRTVFVPSIGPDQVGLAAVGRF